MPSYRILHTESSMELGGQEIRVLEESRGMIKRGHTVVLAAQPGSQISARAFQYNIPVEMVNMAQVRWLWLILTFLKIIKKHRINIVHTHGSIDSWTASIAGRISSLRPLIIRARHKSTMIAKTWRHHVLYRSLPHAVVTTGKVVKQIIMTQAQVHESRVKSIPTGVDTERFHPRMDDDRIRKEFFVQPENFLIGTVAYFRAYKGLGVFLDAAKLVLANRTDVKFLMVGEGPEYSLIVQQREELGLQESIILTGHRNDVPEFLACMDVFVLPSVEAEGVPQTITQAMAMNKAVIATDVGSVREIVQHEKTGLLVEPKNAEVLSRAMLRLVEDKPLREQLGQNARMLVLESYSMAQMLWKTEALYADIGGHQDIGVRL